MASIGPQNPSAATNNGLTNSVSRQWSNPGSVYTSDDSRATAALDKSGVEGRSGSRRLLVTGFDFSAIPADATIDGVVVEVEKSTTSTSGSPKDAAIQLVNAANPFGVGDFKGNDEIWPTTDTYSTYGGAANKWGLVLTRSDVVDAAFGVAISAALQVDGACTVQIDHVRMTVYYTEGASPPAAASATMGLMGVG